jgi:hypothetical protein
MAPADFIKLIKPPTSDPVKVWLFSEGGYRHLTLTVKVSAVLNKPVNMDFIDEVDVDSDYCWHGRLRHGRLFATAEDTDQTVDITDQVLAAVNDPSNWKRVGMAWKLAAQWDVPQSKWSPSAD